MVLFQVIVSDPPWTHSDQLKQSDVKRGAKSQYDGVMTVADIKALPVEKLAQKDALLALWVPGTHVQEGLDVMKAWGFSQKQIWTWVKIKKAPLKTLLKSVINCELEDAYDLFSEFNINNILNFYMGHYFRQTHEICLIGTRGNIAGKIKNKSQRSVFLGPIGSHSKKPEALQDALEKMYSGAKLEMFARRDRPGWECCGNENPSTYGEDITESLDNLL